MTRLSTLAGLVALAFIFHAWSGCACAGVGPGPTAVFSAPLALEAGDRITIRTCHNTACAQGTFAEAPACTGCGVDCGLSNVNAWCHVWREEAGWVLEIEYNARSYELDYGADGDVFSVDVTRDETGEVLLTVVDVVTYELCSSSCGEDHMCVSSGPFSGG